MIPDTVVLQAMRFHTRVGVLPHEKQLPQPVEVDLSVTVDGAVRPPNVVDYVALYSATAAEQYARNQGATEADIDAARHCIKSDLTRTASAQKIPGK